MNKKKKSIVAISVALSASAVVATPVILLTSCAQSTEGKIFNDNPPNNQTNNPLESNEILKEPTGTVTVDNKKYADIISSQLPQTEILIPSQLDLNTLTEQELNQYINERTSLNVDSIISNVNEWNKERGIDNVLDPTKIVFEKDNTGIQTYSNSDTNSNTAESEVNLNLKYQDSEPVKTRITLKQSNSVSGTDYATDNEVLARINKYFPTVDLDGHSMKKNIDLEPKLTQDDVDAFIKSNVDLNRPTSLAQQDLVADNLINTIDPLKLKFEFDEAAGGKVRVYAKYSNSKRVRTEMTISNIYFEDQQVIGNIKLPATPPPLKQIPSSSFHLDATNLGAVNGMYPVDVVLSFDGDRDPNLSMQYSFDGHNISRVFHGFEDQKLFFFDANLTQPGRLRLDATKTGHAFCTMMNIIENPFARTRLFADNNGQFTINNDTVKVSADIRTTNPEVNNDYWKWSEYVEVDNTQNQYFWWDTTDNKIVSNEKSFTLNKYNIKKIHEYRLIITSKGRRVGPYGNNSNDWRDISYLSPETIKVRPYDPANPNGQNAFIYEQDFSTNSYMTVNNDGYLDGFDPTVIKANPINFQKDYKLTWYKDNNPITNYSNRSVLDSTALTYTATAPGVYTIQIMDGNGVLKHISKPIEIKENILKDASRISVGGMHKDGFENWYDLYQLQTIDTPINLPNGYVRVPNSYKMSIYDTNTNTVFDRDFQSKELYALRYNNDLSLKIRSSITLFNKNTKEYVDITYNQPDSLATKIKAFSGEFNLHKPTNPTPEDEKIVECFRWAVKKTWSAEDDHELRNIEVADVTERQLNSYYKFKKCLYLWLVALYPEYQFKVKPTNLVFKIKDRDLVNGMLYINLGYASDGVNFAWSNLPIKIDGFDNDTDQAIADAIAIHNNTPIKIENYGVDLGVMYACNGAVNVQNLKLDYNTNDLAKTKVYNVSFSTKYEDRRAAFDNYEKNLQETGLPGLLDVYVNYNGAQSKTPIKVYGFAKGNKDVYYYTAAENAERFAKFNSTNPNLIAVRDIFPTNLINNELNINDILVDDFSWNADASGCTGFYTDRSSRSYFSFVTTEEARLKAMETGKLEVRLKFRSPIDWSTAVSKTTLTIRGFRTYTIQHDNKQVYTDKQIADMLFNWNNPGFRQGIVINEDWLNERVYSGSWIDLGYLYQFVDKNPWLLEGLIANKLPEYIDRRNIQYQFWNASSQLSYIGTNQYEYVVDMKIGYKSPQNQETMWSSNLILVIRRGTNKYHTFDLVSHRGYGEH